MASILIDRFAGIMPELSARLKPAANAQIAHNCLLTDGTLRPQAKWVLLRQRYGGPTNTVGSIIYDAKVNTTFMYRLADAVYLPGEPFASNQVVGGYYPEYSLYDRPLMVAPIGSTDVMYDACVSTQDVSATITYTRSYDSNKPVNRMYAATRVRKLNSRSDESTLIPLADQQPTDVLYEGDLVEIQLTLAPLALEQSEYIRLYRTISGLDTGENVTNELDTEWHLVAEFKIPLTGSVTYIDGESATASPLDVCYSRNFHYINLDTVKFAGLSESGWFIAANESEIQVSERYMHHAWPVDNHYSLQGETITDLAVHKDNAYIGTNDRPYIMSLAAGEDGLQAAIVPFSESLPCLPGTMTSAAGGAMYASSQGLVALSREGQQLITRGLINAGDVLYNKPYVRLTLDEFDNPVETETELKATIGDTKFGTYYQGKYYGFVGDVIPRRNSVG